MSRFLVQIDSRVWGQGKTATVRRVASWLRDEAGLGVGGFSLHRVYELREDGSFRHAGYDAWLYSTGHYLEIARQDRPEWYENVPSSYRTDAIEERQAFHVDLEAIEALVEHCHQDLDDPEIEVMVFDEMGPILTRGPTRKRRRGRMAQALLEDVIASDTPLAMVVFSDVRQKDRQTATARWRDDSQALGVPRIRFDFVIRENNFRILGCRIGRMLRNNMPTLEDVRVDPLPA